MKALPSIAFSEFTGSAGDVTARSIGGRTLLNHKAYQSKVKTPAQAVSRNTLSKVSRAYKQLTDSQMKAWGALAQHLKGVSIFGQPARMTAHNAFVCLNANRQLAGMTMLSDAPDYNGNIPAVTYGKLWITEQRVLLTGVKNPTNDYRLVVKMSSGQGVGVSSAWSKVVVVSPGMIDNWGDAAMTQLYNDKIGYLPKVGSKIFVEMCWLDPESGLTGPLSRMTRFCLTEEQAEEEGFVERIEYTMDDVVENENVLAFDVDYSSDSPAAVIDVEFKTPPGYGFIYINMKREIPDDQAGFMFALARDATPGKYNPLVAYFGVSFSGTSLSTFKGTTTNAIKMFGSAVLFENQHA